MPESKSPGATGRVTRILRRMQEGDAAAQEELLPLLYDELRSLARAHMRRERRGHTLQPTALTHEAYLRIVGSPAAGWNDRTHFLAAASRVMRRILVEHARARLRKKRGGGRARVALEHAPGVAPPPVVDYIALEEALQRLEAVDARKVRVVELLYFGGLTAEEASTLLGVSSRTAERDWAYARLWLLRAMTGKR